MPTVMITGAGRGLGLEFVSQYAADNWRIIACCRNPAGATALRRTAGEIVIQALDVNNQASVTAAGAAQAGEKIDVLINNAGIIGDRGDGLGTMDYDKWHDCLVTNLFGPMRVTEAFVAQLMAGEQKKLVTVSSRMGSIGNVAQSGSIIYRSSKAAVNMAMTCVANDLGPKGATVVMFHPGWVQTDMGGGGADITAAESVTGMRAVIGKMSHGDNGKFFNYDGGAIAW